LRIERERLAAQSVLVVGIGGLGCPAALVLARAGIGRLLLCDDDVVEMENLHRQILFSEDDVGKDKLAAARRALLDRGAAPGTVELVPTRLLPENARELVRSVDLVVEGADNFATKFLAADACYLEARPLVQGAAVRWVGTAAAFAARGAPCYRCLFEDVPPAGSDERCAEAGVMGPVTGLVGALMADLTLRALCGDQGAFGVVFDYDGKLDRLRGVAIGPRRDCPLCGAVPSITRIDGARYLAPDCAA
jgi:adenylyltransferase/sulfurtransferase